GVTVVPANILIKYLADETPFDQLLGFANARPVAGDFELGRHVVARLDAALTERFDSAGNSRDGLRSLFQRFSGETLELHSGAPGAFDDLGEAEWTLSLLRLRHCVKLQAKANVP